jgi:hypothetical protein
MKARIYLAGTCGMPLIPNWSGMPSVSEKGCRREECDPL